jgi:crotonobetainyl-CoA:carnitine CoA-transferase CaiB-like acyl-CoA transferase
VGQQTGRPLEGIRILDLTTVVVGPSCTLRLADHGAEVIKLEAPEGDVLRTLGGPSPSGQHSGKYLAFNRNKRAICLDLKQAAARTAVLRILDGCDVLVSNIRPEALARLGLDAAATRAARPRLIHCAITGFGPGGPYRGRPAYDTVIQSVGGVAACSSAATVCRATSRWSCATTSPARSPQAPSWPRCSVASAPGRARRSRCRCRRPWPPSC